MCVIPIGQETRIYREVDTIEITANALNPKHKNYISIKLKDGKKIIITGEIVITEREPQETPL